MAVIGAAAAAQHVDLRMGLHEVAVLPAELDRIAGVEIGGVVQLLVAAPRGVGAQAADALRPALVRFHHALEVGGVGTVDHVVGRTVRGRLVDER